MARWIPPRPQYKREHRTVGFAVLAAFLILLFARLFGDYIPLPYREILFPLALLVGAIILPTLAYLLFRGRGYLRTLRLAPQRREHLPLLIAAFFALLSGTTLLACLAGGIDTLGNTVAAYGNPPASNPLTIILSYLVLAALPALAEAFFFFGIVTVEYERRGAFRAVLMSTLTYALIHFDLRNLPAYILTALLSMLVLYTTNSLFAVLLLHLVYSLAALLLQPYLNALYRYTGSLQLFFFVTILAFLLSLFLMLRLSARTYRLRETQGIGVPRRAVPYAVQFYTVLDALADPTILLSFAAALVGIILL
ncbi:MAG: hypothetical protein IJC99_00575 [Clostridia bacterium]|nr:hypothetical protein [Clostridia bacterium]